MKETCKKPGSSIPSYPETRTEPRSIGASSRAASDCGWPAFATTFGKPTAVRESFGGQAGASKPGTRNEKRGTSKMDYSGRAYTPGTYNTG
jgi:hypothetical protein